MRLTSRILTLFLLLFCTHLAWGQRVDSDIKFRLAQSYERSGDVESAVKIYQDLFARDSTSAVVFDALRRGYVQLKRYDELITLLNRMLKRSPKDIALRTAL